MSIVSRARLALRIKSHAALNELEDPLEVLDYAQYHQQETLRKVGLGLIEVATARQRLNRQADRLREQVSTLEGQARRALDANREDLARTALYRKQAALSELTDLEAEIAEVSGEERSLTAAHQQLSARIDAFRHQRASASARYQSAAARVTVSETLTGVGEEIAELGMAVTRAEEKIDRLHAQASALDVLIASRALSAPIGSVDQVERELREIAWHRAVDEELAALRSEMDAAGHQAS